MRICARSGCSSPAAAILTYDRESQTTYLYSVDDPSTRAPGDLCERHLNRFVLPRGWSLEDRRNGAARTAQAASEAPAEVLRALRVAKRTAPARRAKTAAPAARKWAEAGPSLFDAPVNDAIVAPVATEPPPADPVWMPRFGPETELDDDLDAKTPLLRRAFGGR